MTYLLKDLIRMPLKERLDYIELMITAKPDSPPEVPSGINNTVNNRTMSGMPDGAWLNQQNPYKHKHSS